MSRYNKIPLLRLLHLPYPLPPPVVRHHQQHAFLFHKTLVPLLSKNDYYYHRMAHRLFCTTSKGNLGINNGTILPTRWEFNLCSKYVRRMTTSDQEFMGVIINLTSHSDRYKLILSISNICHYRLSRWAFVRSFYSSVSY